MLQEQELIAFLATRDAARAKAFYADTLGLHFMADEPVALVFDAHGTMLRIQKVDSHTAFPYTALGWRVADITAEVEALTARGVRFERYEGFNQDAQGIWSAPSGARVAWFKDPDENVLSLTQF